MHTRLIPYQNSTILDLVTQISRRPSPQCLLSFPLPLRSLPASRRLTTKPTPSSQPKNPNTPIPPARIGMLLDRSPTNRSALSQIPIPTGDRKEKFTPSPLSRPLGLPYPPLPGQNKPLTALTWRERRLMYLDPGKVVDRRRALVRRFVRPYFQEWKRLEHFKGKSFVGPERLFRRDKALYFPNMWGQTLEKGNQGRDMTVVLRGKVSVVGIQCGVWAEEQVQSFLGEKGNPELKGLVANSREGLQVVDVTVQDHWFKAWLVKVFRYRMRKQVGKHNWGRYFSIRLSRDTNEGLSEEIRDSMGLLNSQVGYVYLLDAECKIRWAGSGHAWDGEVKSLNAGIKRLLDEAREDKIQASRKAHNSTRSPQKEPEIKMEKALA